MGRDDLDRTLSEELDTLLRVEPSPEFRVRLREQLERERGSRRGRLFPLLPLAGAAVAVVVLLVVWLGGSRRAEDGQASPEPALRLMADVDLPAPLEAAAVPANRSRRAGPARRPRDAPAQTDVLFADDERRGYAAFLAHIREGRLTAEMFEEPGPPSDVIEPLVVEPLAAIPPIDEEGL